MTVTLYLIKLIDVRKILYKILMNIGFYIKLSSDLNQQLNEKAKTTNNGSFLKLFKTRVLSSLKIAGLRPRIFKLDKTPMFGLTLHIKKISYFLSKKQANFNTGKFRVDVLYSSISFHLLPAGVRSRSNIHLNQDRFPIYILINYFEL